MHPAHALLAVFLGQEPGVLKAKALIRDSIATGQIRRTAETPKRM
jgi:hypothetical protein